MPVLGRFLLYLRPSQLAASLFCFDTLWPAHIGSVWFIAVASHDRLAVTIQCGGRAVPCVGSGSDTFYSTPWSGPFPSNLLLISRHYPLSFGFLSRGSTSSKASSQPQPTPRARITRQQSGRRYQGISCTRPRDRSRHNRRPCPNRACNCAAREREGRQRDDQSYALPHHERWPIGARRLAGSPHPSNALRCLERAATASVGWLGAKPGCLRCKSLRSIKCHRPQISTATSKD